MKLTDLLKPTLVLLTSATLFACGGNSGQESSLENVVPNEPDPIIRGTTAEDQAIFEAIDPETSGSIINVSIFDSVTQALLDIPVNIVVTDLSKENALEVEGDLPEPDTAQGETYSFIVENGTTSFKLDDNLTSTEITIRIQAFAEGYTTSGQSVTVGSIGETGNIELTLVNSSNTPEFVSSTSEMSSSNNGMLTEDVMVQSTSMDTETGEELAFSFELPESTPLTDANGEPLNEGELEISVTYFDPRNEEAAEVFPGGLTFDEDTEGVDEVGEFITAGLVTIQITDDEGNQVSELGTDGGTITVSVPSDLVNPETGEAIEVGDEVPLWSRDDETGQWTLEGTATVTMNADGELELSSQVTHLTSYNYDWFGTGRCPSRALNLLDINGNPLAMTTPLYISITNSALRYGYSGRKKTYYDAVNTVRNTPPTSSSWDVYDSYTATTPIASLTQTGCSDVTFNLDYTFPTPEFELVIKTPSLIAPTRVTYYDVERLLKEADVKQADRETILEITHPGSMPELRSYASYYSNYAAYSARRQQVLISDLYQRFLDEGHLTRDDIATIQSVLAMQYQLSGSTARLFYYYISNDRSFRKYGYININDMPASGLTLPLFTAEGYLYMSASGYMIDSEGRRQYFYGRSSQSVNLNNQSEFAAEFTSIFAIAAAYNSLINNLEQ